DCVALGTRVHPDHPARGYGAVLLTQKVVRILAGRLVLEESGDGLAAPQEELHPVDVPRDAGVRRRTMVAQRRPTDEPPRARLVLRIRVDGTFPKTIRFVLAVPRRIAREVVVRDKRTVPVRESQGADVESETEPIGRK